MPRGIPADRSHKQEIITKIRDYGLSVSEASAGYQLGRKEIRCPEKGELDRNTLELHCGHAGTCVGHAEDRKKPRT
jgi:hypothetical protein